MTEPENFDEDLFADLYADDDLASKAPPAPQVPEVPAAAPAPLQDDYGNTANGYEGGGGGGGGQANNEVDDDDDDDVDFNLGNGSTSVAPHDDTPSYSAPAPAPMTKGPNAKEDGKMFIGGLNWETTDQSLRDYFSQFGEVTECTVMRDGATGRSRGFGFLTFKDPKTVNIVMVKEHYLDGKIIDPKRAIPRDEQEKTSKIFVGGVSQETTDQEFRDYFAQFGRVVDATLMMDKDTGRPRGFGFVTFESDAGVDACLNASLEIHGKPIEVKKAQPRGNMREEEEANRRGGKFRKGGSGGMEDQGTMGQQMGAAGGMTPQMMAQYFQRMQQYMAMMQQQQMAMNRGMNMGAMNPAAMMQMMQMQQMQQQMMQQQGRGGDSQGNNPMANMANMTNMNPQMMQQMQQMMAQQQQGGQDGGAQGAGNQGASNRPGYDAQEQQVFEQQKYDQQGRRGARDNQQQQYGQGGYGMGGAAPTSWEGMYDDVPQPNANQGRGGFRNRGGGFHQQQQMNSQNAPPANAPTGPKNAGRPGANYRGGGRGGNRGYHPYARG